MAKLLVLIDFYSTCFSCKKKFSQFAENSVGCSKLLIRVLMVILLLKFAAYISCLFRLQFAKPPP